MPLTEPLHAALSDALQRYAAPGDHLVLALSGGIDSVCLLHALHTLADSRDPLTCVHVHHGLSPHADAWADFCASLCAQYQVPLTVHRVDIRRDPDGLEAAARTARHRIFAQLDADIVLTAHQQNDQAETLLHQLLRGAGPKGLAAMPAWQRHPAWRAAQLRPWLAIPREAIERYAREHALVWMEDESNSNTAYSRNYLRHTLMPLLSERFPAVVPTLARSAALQAEASALLQDIAELDAQQCIADGRLDCRGLAALSPPRARNLLRAFIAQHGLRMPSERRLDEALRQVLHAANDAQVSVLVQPGVALRRYRQHAYLVPLRVCAKQEPIAWRGEPLIRLVQAGWAIAFDRVQGEGLSLARLQKTNVTLGVRQGGERMRQYADGVHRSLKNLLQEAGLPPWQRACVPLLWCDDQLVWTSGVGADAQYCARADEPGVVPVAHALQANGADSGIIASRQ